MHTDQSVINSTQNRIRRPQDRSHEVVQAAMKLFVERGFAATKLEDVARAAGVSKGLPYLYFRSKEGLFKAVIAEAILEPLALGEQYVAGFEGHSADLLRALLERYRAFNASPSGGVTKLVIGEAGNFPDVARYFIDEIDHRGRLLFETVLRRGIERGEFRPITDVPATAIAIVSPLSMFAIWQRSLAAYDATCPTDDAFHDAHLDLVLAGLRP
jgi:AcrR family transcriptional regulator